MEGINYGPTVDTYADDAALRHRKEHDRENSIGLGGWRIELSPKDAPVATNFLVVLQATDPGEANVELAAWIHGKLYLHYTGFRWRSTPEAKIKKGNK